MSLSMLNGRLKIRVMHRSKRPFHQLTEVPPQPYTTDRDRSNEIHPVEMKCAVFHLRQADARVWRDQIDHVKHTHHENEDGKRRKPLCLSLKVLFEQHKERKREVEKD